MSFVGYSCLAFHSDLDGFGYKNGCWCSEQTECHTSGVWHMQLQLHHNQKQVLGFGYCFSRISAKLTAEQWQQISSIPILHPQNTWYINHTSKQKAIRLC